MHFLYPSFLFALFLIAIPVIIHLFNFRRYKKIVFSDIRFLKSLVEQNKKQQSIKQWLLLLCRILAIAFLVFAFAQPFMPNQELAKSNSNYWVSVYIDNSFSMTANSKEGSLLEVAKSKAKDIVGAYKNNDQFQLLTNDFEGKQQRFLNKKDFLQALEEVEASSVHRNFEAIHKRQISLGLQQGSSNGQLYWISDFQENMQSPNWKIDSLSQLFLLPINGDLKQNVWIDSAWLVDPIVRIGKQNKIKVRIKNQSETAFENQALALKVDGVQKAIQTVSCLPGQSTEVLINLSLNDFNWHGIELSITDYPIIFDDTYYLSIRARAFANVLLLNDEVEVKSFKNVYGVDPFYHFKITSFGQINFEEFAQQSLIILNEPKQIGSGLSAELLKYVKAGGQLLFVPSHKPADLSSIRQFAMEMGFGINQLTKQNIQIAKIESKDPLFANVFSKVPELTNLPVCSECWQIEGANLRTLIQFNNDQTFLSKIKRGDGYCFISSSAFSEKVNSISKHALFVPIMLNMPLQSGAKNFASFTLGQQSPFQFEVNNSQKIFSLQMGKSNHLFEAKIFGSIGYAQLNGQLQLAGIYNLLESNQVQAKLAFNYPRSESYQGFLAPGQLKNEWGAQLLEKDIKLLKAKIEKETQGTDYWQWALTLALIFLLLEMAIIRWMK